MHDYRSRFESKALRSLLHSSTDFTVEFVQNSEVQIISR